MKKVYFDTSYLNRVKSKEIDVNRKFPTCQYLRFVQGTVFDEFFLNGHESWHEREQGIEFWEKNSLEFLDEVSIIFEEYIAGKEYVDSEEFWLRTVRASQECKKNIFSFLRDEPQLQQKAVEYRKSLKKRIKANKSQWESIKLSDKDDFIMDKKNIENDILEIINDEDKLKYYIELIFNIFNKEYIRSDSDFIDEFISFEKLRKIKKDFPSLYNIIVYMIFVKNIRRPGIVKTRKNENFFNSFKFKISSKIIIKNQEGNQIMEPMDCIELTKNFLPDFRVAIFGLYCMDFFVTCDKNQAALLIYLYPDYAKKILWFKQPIVFQGNTSV